jgi:hypothetical protein
MAKTKNIFKCTVVTSVVSDSQGYMSCITTLMKLRAGNTVILQNFEQWRSKEKQDFISNLSTWA